MKLHDKLIQYFDAGYPIIYINSYEEIKTDLIIRNAAGGRKIDEWNAANFYCEFETKNTHFDGELTLDETLKTLSDYGDLNKRMLVLKDAVPYFSEPRVVALLKDIALQIESGLDSCIVIVSSVVSIPKELEKYITVLETDPLTEAEIIGIVRDFCNNESITISDALLEKMSIAFKGLSEFDIENIISSAVARDGDLSNESLDLIFEQKKQMIMKSGILDMIDVKEKKDDIGGLDNLKKWLDMKSNVYKNINKAVEYGVDMPKGVLIAGVPGCGKSLTAKATSSMFSIPLMKMDIGKLLGKYVGESEENMHRAIKLAEEISPCVLWVDELEKAFAGIGGNGNEVTQRLFGTFLTWMQEKTAPVFVVATANDIEHLPAEFMRKGRFDDIFYVDLPSEEERRSIFEIHITKRRRQDLDFIDTNELAALTKGYSGADIEGIVRETIELAFGEGKNSITTHDLKKTIEQTKSISDLMNDYISKLKSFYEKNNFKKA